MSVLGYTALSQFAFPRKQADQIVAPHETNRTRYHDALIKISATIPTAILLVAGFICLAILAGFVASKVFILNISQTDHPVPLPEGFFPSFGKVSVAFANGGEFTRNDTVGDAMWDSLVPVRQAIMCTADMTLEHANADGSFTAEQAVHQCRDWSLVKAFLEDNRAEDDTGGIIET
ncbi:hypothetical protein BJ878DRAFT_543056 [Calycina marina]|uniref:Uncharacterized protein n=1 Tax=Calycina marina TaxID=1763456 RepID=A0A9P8CE26_9HELO|nr:hypothetical protein BJ878DRAFT_543056 [Calycina marina]